MQVICALKNHIVASYMSSLDHNSKCGKAVEGKHNFQAWGFDGLVFTDRCTYCGWWSYEGNWMSSPTEPIFPTYDDLADHLLQRRKEASRRLITEQQGK